MIDKIEMKSSKSTPEIVMDPEESLIRIKGQSYPENSFKFYEPVIDWIKSYLESDNGKGLRVELMINYLNTSSAKSIMEILDLLDESFRKGRKIEINWYYDKENELAYEMAEDFMEDMELRFNLIENENK